MRSSLRKKIAPVFVCNEGDASSSPTNLPVNNSSLLRCLPCIFWYCTKPKQDQQYDNQPETGFMAYNVYHPSPRTSLDLGGVGVFPSSIYLISSYERQHGVVRSMAAGPGGLLYTGSDSMNIRLWIRGKSYAGFNSYDGPNYALLLNSQGHLFAANYDGTVRVWVRRETYPPSYRHIGTFPSLKDRIREALWRKKIRVMQKFERLYWHTFPTICISLSEDMRFLYSGSTDHTMKIWRLKDWKLIESKKEHRRIVTAVAAGCDHLVFSGSEDGSIIMWLRKEEANGKDITHFRVQFLFSGANSINALLLKSNGTGTGELYAGFSNGKVMSWQETNHWAAAEVLSYHHEGVTCLASSPGPLVFSGSLDGKICAWRREPDNGLHTLVMVLSEHEGPINCIAAHEDWEENDDGPCRCILYSGSQDQTLKTWRIADAALNDAQCGR
ncbi:F-box/WD repeat-containing protein 11-like protein [Carex littledalei]|uniref:F-box/WD repeat-containing protein 11-like protein n=1 Tax=Carex littledalei TaxID=544730 RepID=A0A833VFB9_9POAL|nr:F-box/WD repeat-containing protein 11-like protein [Carex littledalei]